MLDTISDSVFVTDQAGVVLFVNRSGLELLGLGPEEVIGRDFRELARAVTEIRKPEELRQEFMRMVGHELRNPVQLMKGISQVLRLRLSSNQMGDAPRLLDFMDRQLNRIARLLEDILLAYRTGSGRLSLQVGPVDLSQMVADSLAPYTLAGTHDIAVETDGRELTVLCDRERVAQILGNLLDNATKYTPPGNKVRVFVRLAGPDQAVVTVEDEGIGIPQDELEKVFSGFYRARNVRGYASGLGLGLYISRELARCQGGDVWAETVPAGGTRMHLRLPLCKEDARGGTCD